MKVDFIDGSKRAVALENETCNLTPYGLFGEVTIFAGFIWDGASVPDLLHGVLFINQWHPAVRRAGKWHDKAYQSLWNRKKSDRMYRMMCLEDGATIAQAWVMYIGLRMFGWVAYNKYRRAKNGK